MEAIYIFCIWRTFRLPHILIHCVLYLCWSELSHIMKIITVIGKNCCFYEQNRLLKISVNLLYTVVKIDKKFFPRLSVM